MTDFRVVDGVLVEYTGPGGHVAVPGGVTEIGRGAFLRCVALRRLSLPTGLLKIGEGAFIKCRQMEEVTLPATLAKLGERAFMDCSGLSRVALPAGIAEIPKGCFQGCESLARVALQEGVESVGARAFDGCGMLDHIQLPSSLVRVGSRAFSGVRRVRLRARGWPEGLEEAVCEDVLRRLDVAALDSVPGRLLPLAVQSFISDPERDPESERTRLAHAFLRGNALRSLVDSMKSLPLLRYLCRQRLIPVRDLDAFLAEADSRRHTEALRALLEATDDQWTAVDATRRERRATRAAYLCARARRSAGWDFDRNIAGLRFVLAGPLSQVWRSVDELRDYLERFGAALDDTVTPLADFMISDDPDGKTVTAIRARELGVPFLTEAEFNALVGARFPDRETFVVPGWITEIGSSAFKGCRNMKKVVLHEGVTRIGNYAFAGCFNLAEVNLPAGLASIGAGAFQNCTSLGEIRLPAGLENLGERAFENCASLGALEIPTGITEVGAYLCKGCTALESAALPDALRKIGAGAFERCERLKGCALPEGVAEIEDGAFSGCTGLSALQLPRSLRRVGPYAFSGCTGLREVFLPSGLEAIGGAVFEDCRSLERVMFRRD